MKKLFIALFFAASISMVQGASYKSGIFISYSESADYFEIMENLSIVDGKIAEIYRKNIEKTFLDTSEDRQWISWYKEFRKKYYRKIKESKEGIFQNQDLVTDPIMESFYTSERPLKGITELKDKISSEELTAVGKFYEHFNSKIAELVRLSAAREAEISSLDKELKKANFKSIFNQAATFFNIPKHLTNYLRILFVWYPKDEDMVVDYANNYIIVRIHPEKSSDLKKEDVMKWMIHYLMRVMPSGQKKVLSEKLMAGCNPTKYVAEADYFQEPIAVMIGDVYFTSKFDRKNFDLSKIWSKNPWINLYSKLLFPSIEKSLKNKQSVQSGEFIESAVRACDDLLTLGKLI